MRDITKLSDYEIEYIKIETKENIKHGLIAAGILTVIYTVTIVVAAINFF